MRDFIKKTWIILSNSLDAGDLMINCTRSDLDKVLLYQNFEGNNYEIFEYKSDEYWMYIMGDDYNVNKNYNEISKQISNIRIKDARAIVYHILKTEKNIDTEKIAQLFNKDVNYIIEILDYHALEYKLINEYKKMYENTLTHFNNWSNTDLDLCYYLTKTKYDNELDIRYEQILNNNNRLEHEIGILKIKLNKLKKIKYV